MTVPVAKGHRDARVPQRGIALVVVLWVVALLGLMAVSQTAAVRTETRVVGNELEAATARAGAFAGLQLAMAELARPLSERGWHPDGTLYSVTYGALELQVALSDEAGKVDLNAAPAPLLDALLAAGGVAEDERPAAVDAILDWRDRDDLPRVHGAEAEAYRQAGRDYAPRNGAFQSLEELVLVLGFDAQRYHALREGITIYSGNGGVNPSLAPPVVLQALAGVSASGGDWSDRDPGATPPARGDLAAYGTGGGGRVFTVYVQAQTPGGVRERLEAVVHVVPTRSNVPLRYEFLRWRQGVPPRVRSGG